MSVLYIIIIIYTFMEPFAFGDWILLMIKFVKQVFERKFNYAYYILK